MTYVYTRGFKAATGHLRKNMSKLRDKIIAIKKLTSLADGLYMRLALVFLSLWLPIKKKLGLRPAVDFTGRFKFRGKSFIFFIEDYFDLLVLPGLLYDEQYVIDLPEPPQTIIDLGSNVGASVVFFALMYPNAEIYAFEPHPALFPKLVRNTRQFPNVTAYPYAVSDKTGILDFFIYEGGPLSSSLSQRKPGQQATPVQVYTLDHLLDDLKLSTVDLIKFDIEGAEFPMFHAFRDKRRIRHYIGTLHPELIPGTTQDFISFFEGFPASLNRALYHHFTFEAHTV